MVERTRAKAAARRRRMSAAQVRESMLGTGRESAWRSGLTLDLNDAHFDDLIRIAEVPRSSVFRIWPTKADFVVELFESLGAASDPLEALHAENTAEIKALIDEHSGLLGTADGRRKVLEEVVRVSVAADILRRADSLEWQVFTQMVLTSPVLTDLPDGTRIVDAIVASQAKAWDTPESTGLTAFLANPLGLKLRGEGFTHRGFAVAVSTITDGVAANYVTAVAAAEHAPEVSSSVIATLLDETPGTGIDGGEAPWSAAARAVLGVLDAYYEPAS